MNDSERDLYMEAVIGGRLMFHYPLGSIKEYGPRQLQADRLGIRHMRLQHINHLRRIAAETELEKRAAWGDR